jgi:hypothetical protein
VGTNVWSTAQPTFGLLREALSSTDIYLSVLSVLDFELWWLEPGQPTG